MIVGNDVSNFQGRIDWETYARNTNFVIMKASEGTGYIDTWFGNNRQQSRLLHIPRGFYHFARPDVGNSAKNEATFFCNLVDGDPIQTGEVLVLDYEVNYVDPVGWCKTWLDQVSNHFNGIKPLVYLNQSLAAGHDWSPVVNAGYALWIAAYTYDPNNNSFNPGAWKSAVIQQWTDVQQVPGIQGNIDGDVFFGDAQQFQLYGYQAKVSEPITNISSQTPQVPTQTVEQNTPSQQPIQLPASQPQVPASPVKKSIVQRIIDWLITFLSLR